MLDGIPTNQINKYDLRRQISLVQQDVFLFSGSILDNIRLGNSHLEVDQIKSIAKSVNLHRFVDCLPDQYEQNIRERGSLLSLGQKQLLSFARALAADPRILVLDEATSSVDPGTELRIQATMKKLTEGRTSFIVAHRLSTIRRATSILFVRDGEITESGSHAELIRLRGAYFDLLSHVDPEKEML